MDVTILLIVAALTVAGFVMLSDTKKNDNFGELERRAREKAARNPPQDPLIDTQIDPLIEPWSDEPPGRR
jgi:hypothetical protein